MSLGKDLEVIVSMLEVGAIGLTNGPDDRFTKAELYAEGRRIFSDVEFDDRDLDIVLPAARFLRRYPGNLLGIR